MYVALLPVMPGSPGGVLCSSTSTSASLILIFPVHSPRHHAAGDPWPGPAHNMTTHNGEQQAEIQQIDAKLSILGWAGAKLFDHRYFTGKMR